MNRKPVKDQFDMDAYMSGKGTTEAPQKTANIPTKAPQKHHKEGPLQKYHIRLTEEDWKSLQQHFTSRGIKTAAGIRMVLKEYIKNEGL